MRPTNPRISAQLDKLEQFIQILSQNIKNFSDDELMQRPAPGKWSKKEILGHLIDSATYNWQRFINIQFSEQPFQIIGYVQNELVKRNDYHNKPLNELLELWKQINRQILLATRPLDEDQLNLKVTGAPWSPYHEGNNDLAWLINDYVAHLEYHLRQILGPLEVMDRKLQTQVSSKLAQQRLKAQKGQRFVTLMQHGSMSAEWYEPQQVDLQTPHEQDELYVVMSGSGIFNNNGLHSPFVPGDLLFVPAGVEHRFEEFTDDFKTWVIFYGPQGGETILVPTQIQQQFGERTYTISTDPARLDPIAIHDYLTRSYWAKGRSLEMVRQALPHSYCFGLYHHDQQIGLARVVTDFTGFAYLCDVYILEAHRGQGVGKWLIESVINDHRLCTIKSWLLFTADAQGLYERYGFKVVEKKEEVMKWERK